MSEKIAKSSGLFCQFAVWLPAFNVRKTSFPEPWKSMSAEDFPASRKVPGSKKGEEYPVNRNAIKAIQAMKGVCSKKHYVAVNEDHVLVEYHSEKNENVEFATFNFNTMEMSLTLVEGAATGSATSYTSIKINADEHDANRSTGASLYMAIMFGMLMKYDASGSPEGLETFLNAWKTAVTADILAPATSAHIRESYGILSAEFYKTVCTKSSSISSWIGSEISGIDTSGMTNKLSEMDIADLVDGSVGIKAHPFASRPLIGDILSACEFLNVKDTVFFSKISEDAAREEGTTRVTAAKLNKMPAEERMKALRDMLQLDIHPLTDKEKEMVPELSKHYVVDQTLLDVAKTIKADWKLPGLGLAPNYILEGDSGSGKTEAAKFFASVHNIPYTKMTMNPTFESANLVGAFYPMYSDMSDWNISKTDMKVLEALRDAMENDKLRIMASPKAGAAHSSDLVSNMRMAFGSDEVRDFIRKAYKIPDFISCFENPAAAWKQLGHKTPAPEAEDIVAECEQLAENKLWRLYGILAEQAQSGNVSYRFVLSEIMKAFQHGWCIEIQEAASILRPGVLTELNSLLEPGGRLELANGQYITRHPDTIVIFTTNREYAGNVDLNESLRDRCLLGVKMDLPDINVMAERAVAQTGCDDMALALSAAKVVRAICDEAKAKNIKGSYGPRSLYAWILDLMRGDFSDAAFRRRVIEKMTTNEDDISILMTIYKTECDFKSKVRKGRRV